MNKPDCELIAAVQTNCHIADARHAGDLTLCTYLLEMFEFYRWEQGMGYERQPARADVGLWLSEREQLWESLEDEAWQPLPIDGEIFEPFAVLPINERLGRHGLVYGFGIGRMGKPQFFLAQLLRQEERDGATILIAGHEYARDLSGPPAALLGTTIYLRQESFKRWFWQKFEAWKTRRPQGALAAALTDYGFDRDPCAALERVVEGESESLILHELGELEAGRRLGEDWGALRARVADPLIEWFLRALRDNLADCLVTHPALAVAGRAVSLEFWFANFEGMRREMFPSMAAAYRAWCGGDRGQAVAACAARGAAHWQDVCMRAMALEKQGRLVAGMGFTELCEVTGAIL